MVIVDHDDDFRESTADHLRRSGFAVAGAPTAEEAIALVRADPPVAVVVEVALPGVSGYEACRQLRDEFGDSVAIIFVSGDRTESYDRVAGLLVGADDYLSKPFAPDELVARILTLARRTPVPSSAEHASGAGLTGRELQVLELLAHGLRQPEIAERLFISPKTVAGHIEHILEKLGVHSRAEAVAVAYRDGFVEAPG